MLWEKMLPSWVPSLPMMCSSAPRYGGVSKPVRRCDENLHATKDGRMYLPV